MPLQTENSQVIDQYTLEVKLEIIYPTSLFYSWENCPQEMRAHSKKQPEYSLNQAKTSVLSQTLDLLLGPPLPFPLVTITYHCSLVFLRNIQQNIYSHLTHSCVGKPCKIC